MPSDFFKLPNAQAYRYADTGGTILRNGQAPTSAMRLGSSTGALYAPPGAPSLGVPAIAPVAGAAGTKPGDRYSLFRQTINPELQKMFQPQFGKLGANETANATDLAAYTKNLLANSTKNLENLTQEQNSIDDIFSGKLSGDLAGLRKDFANTQRVNRDWSASTALGAIKGQSAGTGLGGLRYNLRSLVAPMAQQGAADALALNQQAMNDNRYVTGLQNSMLGRREQLATANAGTGLLGAQARSNLTRDELGNLGALSQLQNGNEYTALLDSREPFFPSVAPQSGYVPGNFNFPSQPSYQPRRSNSPEWSPGWTRTIRDDGKGEKGEDEYTKRQRAIALAQAQERERARIRGFYDSPTPQYQPYMGNTQWGEGEFPSNFPDVSRANQNAYEDMYNMAPQYAPTESIE